MKWGEWFKVNGQDARWLARSPVNKVARCEAVWSHVVQPAEPRFVIDTGAGPVRKRGHSKRHEYLCMACAWSGYQTKPPTDVNENQGELF